MKRSETAPISVRRLRVGVFLLALAGMVFQLGLTRLWSAALNYHLTFLAIGAAMVGIGAGGSWVAMTGIGSEDDGAIGDSSGDHRPSSWVSLASLSLGAAAIITANLALFAWFPFRLVSSIAVLAMLIGGFALAAAAFACIGAVVALALQRTDAARGGTYAADLMGAATGCAVAWLVSALGGPPAAVTGAVAALVFAASAFGGWRYRVATGGTLLLTLTVVAAVAIQRPNVLATKPLAVLLDPVLYPGASHELMHWDAFSRVDVLSSPEAPVYWQHAAGQQAGFSAAPLKVKWMTIDADALTAVVTVNAEGQFPPGRGLITSVVYEIAPRGNVLVIGPGGGLDVAAALEYGASKITAVEVNPAVNRLILGPLARFSGHIYDRPGVRLVQDEGRSFVRRSRQRYDAIVLTTVDSWAAVASGGYSLAENYLYTREAMGDFYDHLADGGVLAVTRWYRQPPMEMLRLGGLVQTALADRHLDGNRRTMILRGGDLGTLVLRRGEFSDAETARLRHFLSDRQFELILDPMSPLDAFGGARPGDSRADAATAPAMGPPSDDRPYFFDLISWPDALAGLASGTPLPRGHAVLLVALIQGTCLAVAAIVLPLRRWRRLRGAHHRREMTRAQGMRSPGDVPQTAYFLLIGTGYMLAELSLLQRLTLLLGHPSLALAAGLGGLLAWSGLGSWLASGTWVTRRPWAGPVAAGVGLLAFALWSPWLIDGALGLPGPARVMVAVLALCPLAVSMGTAFPAGMARLTAGGGDSAAWAWGINGAASAIAAPLAVMLAMDFGLRLVLILAAGCYLGCAVLICAWRAPPSDVRRATAG